MGASVAPSQGQGLRGADPVPGLPKGAGQTGPTEDVFEHTGQACCHLSEIPLHSEAF